MPRTAFSKVARNAIRHLNTPSSTTTRSSLLRQSRLSILSQSSQFTSLQACRLFSATSAPAKGISPESEDPRPKQPERHTKAAAPAEITIEEYHEVSDTYINALVERLEQLQEERDDVDVEYSAGVLNLTFPPAGTYVINKQPPNKQIWLSSPISGPKRFDYVVLSEGQDSKEGTGAGEWIYLRDMSTLTSLLLTEVGVDLSEPLPLPQQSGDD